MASYKDIQGFNIQNLSSDPVPFAQEKVNNPWAGTWASGGNMNTGRRAGIGVGITSAALYAGGQTPTSVTNTELYNGSAWTEVNDLNTARYAMGGIGSQTAAICATGYNAGTIQTSVESWNGTSWTEIAELNTPRFYPGASSRGTSTAGLIFGGADPNPSAVNELYNGTTWTEVNDLPAVRSYPAGMGTSTAALSTGAFQAPATYPNSTDEWNGTNWTNLGVTQNTTRSVANSVNAGTTTSALLAGGQSPGAVANTEDWNGSAWTEVNDLSTANETIRGSGTSSSDAWGSGGDSYQASTEEWAFTGIPPSAPAAGYTDAIVGQIYYNTTTGSFKAIKNGGAPIGTWSSGGDLNLARYAMGSAGVDNTSALVFGGSPAPPLYAQTESYDGSAWTEVNDLNTARRYLAGQGTQTAALGFGGLTTVPVTSTESWDGSSWTSVNSMNTARNSMASGTLTAATSIAVGPSTLVELWDGTNWTETTEINTGRSGSGGVGNTAAALVSGGSIPPVSGATELWNGTTWTEVSDLNTARQSFGSAGISTSAVVFGGYTTAQVANTESWDGSAWTEVNDLGTARYYNAGAGIASNNAITAGGDAGAGEVTTTEEWTAADFQITTLTTS